MPRKSPILLITALFLLQCGILYAAEQVGLNSLIAEALKNNPQIEAAKGRYKAAQARVRLLRTLADPRLEYEYDKITASMDAVMNGKTGPMRTFAISQEVPFPTKLLLRREAAAKEARSYEQEYKETERRVIRELKGAYEQLFLNTKKIELTQDSLGLLAQLVEITNKKYAVNKASQQDSLKAQVEYSKLSNQLVLLEQEKRIAGAMLNSLLNRTQGAQIVAIDGKSNKTLELKEEEIIKLAKENRPELKSFKEILRKTEIDLALAKQEYLPDFMLKYKREEKDGGAGSWAGMLGVSVPLWFWEKQDSFVKEAQAEVGVAQAEYQAQVNTVLLEARSSLVKFEAAKKLVAIYETGVLPQALAAIETAQRGFEADKISFLELLDSLRSLRDFQMDYFEACANMEIALADLEHSIGTSPFL